MPLTNYGELKASVADWLDRTDLESQIPDFITLAENEIFRSLRCPGNELWVTYRTADFDNAEGIELPDNYQAVKHVTYGSQPLERRSDQWYLQQMNRVPAAGRPLYFARIRDMLYFYPPADNNEDVQLVYWATEGPLANDADATNTMVYAPGLYLYGALLQAQAYLIGDTRIPVWQAKYDSIMADIMIQAQEAEIEGSTNEVLSVYGDMS